MKPNLEGLLRNARNAAGDLGKTVQETGGRALNLATETASALGQKAKDAAEEQKQKKKQAAVQLPLSEQEPEPDQDSGSRGPIHSVASRVKAATEKKAENSLDTQLNIAVAAYNTVYSDLNDHGTQLLTQRERAQDLLDNVEHLVNSIACHPKSFDADIQEIRVERQKFRETCEFAAEELSAARAVAGAAGAGTAGAIAVASMAPSAAMWVATTFGTASTGTAISALSGAAAQNAALAWLGGGALSAGGGGMVAGRALLAMAGPLGWGISGVTLLTSIVLIANKKRRTDRERRQEIEKVLRNTESVKEMDAGVSDLLQKTTAMRDGLSQQYTEAMALFRKDFRQIPESGQMLLGALVNNARALAQSLGQEVEEPER